MALKGPKSVNVALKKLIKAAIQKICCGVIEFFPKCATLEPTTKSILSSSIEQ
jgi:hypothetical protein